MDKGQRMKVSQAITEIEKVLANAPLLSNERQAIVMGKQALKYLNSHSMRLNNQALKLVLDAEPEK